MSTTDMPTHIIPKVYCDKDGVFTVDFTDNEELAWRHTTEWKCMPSSGKCEIVYSREVHKYFCNLVHHFDNPPTVKLASLRNPEQKVILVLRHDTRKSALGMMTQLTDVKDTVVTFLQTVKIPADYINVSVQLNGLTKPAEQQKRGLTKPAEQQNGGGACLYESTPDTTRKYTSETIWLCETDVGFKVDGGETSQRHFSNLKGAVREKYRAWLKCIWSGSVKFFVHHETTQDALEMTSNYEEVMALILTCLQGIDSTVKEIQMDVQLQDFIDPPSLPEHGDQNQRYVDKQEHDKEVKDLSEQVATLTLQLQKMKEKERAQLADMRLSMWKTRPGSPQPSESSGIFTVPDTMTEVGDEEFQDTTAWSQMEARRPGPTPKSDVPATIRERDTRKSGTPSRPDTRATPTLARRDAGADYDLRDACREGNLAKLKRILATGQADVNCRDVIGTTPVMEAARGGHRDVVDFLVSRGADVSLVDKNGNNILHWACRGGDRKTVKFVLSLDGVDINARNNNGKTAADVARDCGHHQLSDLLVSRGTQ
ncbi:uncharacterized protein LOC124267435 [Haliotis rubra]|uniref:uncharacterized protein LOC124267435 n=1 Tax=Haliotis rubra TaxID=36100 RepID=UPI001EE5FD3A|nr:uncharacterized protein LOC124267435 [Haliotis rubra]